jgi:putative nucleotidyltransferase-like protein
MTLPSEGALLLYYLGVRYDGHTQSRPPRPTMSDWAEALRQAAQNGVTPLLYHRLNKAEPGPEVPPGALSHLREATVRSAAQSLQFGRDLAQVLEAFRRHGIAVIVLKGGHLAQVVYESFALRTMCDLDVMVRRGDLGRAASVLAELGYAPQYYNVEAVDYAQHHHIRPMAKPDGVRVEIHWSIARPTPLFDIDLQGLWTRARRAEIVGVETLVLSPEDLLLHLCLHASFTHKFRLGLRACWDILEVTRHYRGVLDWDVVMRRAAEWRIGKYVYLTLRLVRELLAADIPAATIAALEPPGFPPQALAWARTCIFSPEDGATVSPSMARLWTSRRIKAKLGVLLKTLCPPRAAMARIYGTSPGSRWIYGYYPLRWLDLLVRYGRHAWGLWRGNDRTRDQLRAVSERAALREWLGYSGDGSARGPLAPGPGS